MSDELKSVAQLRAEVERERLRVADLQDQLRRNQRSEETLQQTTAELNAVFQALPDLSFRCDADRRIIGYFAGRASDLYVDPRIIFPRGYQTMGQTLSHSTGRTLKRSTWCY